MQRKSGAAARWLERDLGSPLAHPSEHKACSDRQGCRATEFIGIFGAMDWPDYLRDQAAMYRRLAEQADDPVVKNEMLELASVCEEVANNIEDHLTGGADPRSWYRAWPVPARPCRL